MAGMPLSQQEFVDFLYPQVNEFLKLQHAGDDAQALLELNIWVERTLADPELDPELWEAVYYRCCFLRGNMWIRSLAGADIETQRSAVNGILAEIERPAATAAGKIGQRYARLVTILSCFEILPQIPGAAEIRAMIEELPEEYQDQQIWHALSVVAYNLDRLDLMELSFENATIRPHSKYPQAAWQRINLMYQVMKGTVRRIDILETLRLFHLPSLLREFRQRVYPRLQQLGLIDAEIDALIERRSAELARAEIDFNQPRIDSIRTHGLD
jgi:hypothetical protein